MKKIFTLIAFALAAITLMAQKPTAKINVSKSIWCEGEIIPFGNQSLGADSFFWYMGEGTTFTTKKVSFSYSVDVVEDSFTVSLIAVNKESGESDSVSQLIRVQKRATAYFDYKAIAVVCFLYPKCENYLGLDWEFGDGSSDLKDADSITHIYPGSGTYNCQLVATTSFQCNDTFAQEIVIVDSAGGSIGENNLYGMQLYPNPSKNQVLEFEMDKPEKLTISLTDATGKVIYSVNNTYNIGRHQIQIGEMLMEQSSGLYFVAINNGKTAYVLKANKTQ